jgi:tetratricopeptide (TPR) repeat protein
MGAAQDSHRKGTLLGVFARTGVAGVGTGATKQSTESRIYYFAEEDGEGGVLLRPLNDGNLPFGEPRAIAMDDLFAGFTPEPEYYFDHVRPALAAVEDAVGRGDDLRAQGRLYSAEHEYGRALELDEEHVRATYGLGFVYLERGETEPARQLFGRLYGLDAAFAPEHKHLFNEFGIRLRKSGLLEEALKYYAKALELEAGDDHILHNMARVHHAAGEPDKAVRALERAVELNPDCEESRKFLLYLQRNTSEGPGLLRVHMESGEKNAPNGLDSRDSTV